MTTEYDNGEDMKRQLHAAAGLPREIALMKMENDQIFAVAAAKPRDYAKILAGLKSMIDAFPEAAAEAIYNKPVGTKTEIQCGNCKRPYEVAFVPRGAEGAPCPNCQKWDARWPQTKKKAYARNLSIRAAESIRVTFGFTRVSMTLSREEEDVYKVGCSVTDFIAGNITQDEKLVSQWYTTYNKSRVRHADDRFFDTVLEAAKSKIRRNTILNSVPGELKAAYRDYCEKKITDLLTDAMVDQIISSFATKNVTEAMLEKYIGRPKRMGWTMEDRKNLLGVWNALKEGEAAIDDIFGDKEEPEGGHQEKTVTTPGMTGADITGAKVTVETRPDEKKPEPPTNGAPKEVVPPTSPPSAAPASVEEKPAEAPQAAPVEQAPPASQEQPKAISAEADSCVLDITEMIAAAKSREDLQVAGAQMNKNQKLIGDERYQKLYEQYKAKLDEIGKEAPTKTSGGRKKPAF